MNKPKNVLIIGGAGSLGKSLGDRYHATGWTVNSIDKATGGNIIDAPFNDLGDLILHADLVIQAAATVQGVVGFHNNGFHTLSNDLQVQAKVLDCFKAVHHVVGTSPRLVYISSSMVYESIEIENNQNLGEWSVHGGNIDSRGYRNGPDLCKTPSTDYGLSKLVGERMVRAAANDFGLEYTTWRPFNIITPTELPDPTLPQGTKHVFADLIQQIVVDKKIEITLLGNGQQIRSFTDIDDVVECIFFFSRTDLTKNQEINIGRNQPVTIRELAGVIYDEAMELGILPKNNSVSSSIENWDNDSYNNPLTFKWDDKKTFHDDVKVRIPYLGFTARKLHWAARTPLNSSVRKCLLKYV